MIDPTLLRATVTANVAAALAEDVGDGDLSAALIAPQQRAHAKVITRNAGVFCGAPWVRETVESMADTATVTFHFRDGDRIQADDVLFEVEGPARTLLTAERTMLNFTQLLSGTATRTREFCNLIEATGSKTRLLDTRKTIPGLRVAQKWAVACGGGTNHRMGLFDAFLLKENHIAAAGDIACAVSAARAARPGAKVEVEVESLDELDQAIAAGADIAMIDNFSLTDTVTAVQRAHNRIELEASGGIDETTITDIAATGVDYVSVGSLTKDVVPLDLSLRFI